MRDEIGGDRGKRRKSDHQSKSDGEADPEVIDLHEIAGGGGYYGCDRKGRKIGKEKEERGGVVT